MVMHWLVVGDASGAKVYESDALLEELRLVDEVNSGHERVRQAIDGAHRSDALPGAGPGAAQGQHDPHKVGEERFARALAQIVNEADGKHRFERLVVVVPPRFLGDFRAALSHNAVKRVVASIHHDWTHLHVRELAAAVRKNLPQTAGLG